MARRFTAADEGKRVVTPDGTTIGSVVQVASPTAFVRPRKGLLRGCGSWIANEWRNADVFKLDSQAVVRVTDEEIVLMPSVVDGAELVPSGSP